MKKAPLKLQAYDLIKHNIIHCIYAPDSIITEEMIQADINASRTPIRDALSRLEQEGMIKILPKKGILVTQMTIRDLNMLYEMRFMLEPYCIRNYGMRIPQEQFSDYNDKYTRFLADPEGDYLYEEMDASFHRMIITSSRNTYIINLYSTLEMQIARSRYMTGKDSLERRKATVLEHLAITQAALKEDWEEAAAAMMEHLKISKNNSFAYMMGTN
ncbi:MAG: GntR family transcriptional regulator [Blautia sp.]|nr:GntR family transcriptional regulator [Blautia sp.]